MKLKGPRELFGLDYIGKVMLTMIIKLISILKLE